MKSKFDNLFHTIMESIDQVDPAVEVNETEVEIKPTCSYCRKPVPMDIYEKQKKSYEDFTGVKFKPSSCTCDACSEKLMKMYSNKRTGSGPRWTGD